MYTERVSTLRKAYTKAQKNNQVYNAAVRDLALCKAKAVYLSNLETGLQILANLIAKEEERWQEGILRRLEAEIMQDLSYVYPTDGYRVSLKARLLRGKIHIDTAVHSYFMPELSGDIDDTQGRLFQQIVSFAALIGIMEILGVKTVYIDEAFSGAALENVGKVNALLESIRDRGFNLVIIAQNTAMARGLDANILLLSRSMDNKTQVVTGGM